MHYLRGESSKVHSKKKNKARKRTIWVMMAQKRIQNKQDMA